MNHYVYHRDIHNENSWKFLEMRKYNNSCSQKLLSKIQSF